MEELRHEPFVAEVRSLVGELHDCVLVPLLAPLSARPYDLRLDWHEFTVSGDEEPNFKLIARPKKLIVVPEAFLDENVVKPFVTGISKINETYEYIRLPYDCVNAGLLSPTGAPQLMGEFAPWILNILQDKFKTYPDFVASIKTTLNLPLSAFALSVTEGKAYYLL